LYGGAVTTEQAVLCGTASGQTPTYRMNLQTNYKKTMMQQV